MDSNEGRSGLIRLASPAGASEMIDDILTIDWDQVRLRRAAWGLLAMLIGAALIWAVGDVALTVLLSTLFVIATGGTGTMAQRLPGMVRFTVYGAVLGGLAFWSADNAITVAIVLGATTYVATIAAAIGPATAHSGIFLTLWALFALMLGSAETNPLSVSVAFIVGGAIAISLTALRFSVSADDDAGVVAEDAGDAIEGARWLRPAEIAAAATSPIGWFAILRSAAVLAGVIVGFSWFPSYPLWVALTVIVVLKPSTTQSASIAIQRTLGTALGVAVAVGVAQIFPRGEIAVMLAFLASGFLMVAFNNANYTLFATFLTATLVFAQRLLQADAFEAGWDRLLATITGAVISFAAVAIVSMAERLAEKGHG